MKLNPLNILRFVDRLWLPALAFVLLTMPLVAHAQGETPPPTPTLPTNDNVFTVLAAVTFLALVANRVTEGLAAPIRQRYPTLDLWWLVYVSWVIGGVLSYFAGLNLFTAYFPVPAVGIILTAIVVGGGGNLIDALETGLKRINPDADTSNSDSERTVTPLTSHKPDYTRRDQ
jgi:hypothetical protein